LPAGIANTTPALFARIPFIKKNFLWPLDFGRKFKGKRIFGENKSIFGLITGALMAILVVYLEKQIFINSDFVREFSYLNYNEINPVILGSLLGIGALAGDAVESFFKRQKGVKSGDAWFPFDQIDYILGGLLLASLYIDLRIETYFYILVIWFLLHLTTNFIGFHVGLKDKPI
jgi:CDP-2,3-bis-(O-geranylgeranyl)-sn-glycerol synthase